MTLLGGEKKTPIQLGNNVPKVTLANKSVNCKRMPRGGVGGEGFGLLWEGKWGGGELGLGAG